MMKKSIKRILSCLLVVLILLFIIVRNPTISFSESTYNSSARESALQWSVNYFASINPPRSYHYPDSLNQASDYIENDFKKYCDEVELQPYIVNGVSFKNVICRFKGKNPQKIIIGAHYDVAGEMPGADDNASGVSGIMELAYLIKSNKLKPNNDIEIVAYTLEEPPVFKTKKMGSYIHANSINKASVKYMVSVEMIGFYSDELFSQKYPIPLLYLFFPLKGNFITIIGGLKEYLTIRDKKTLLQEGMGDLNILSFNAPPVLPGIDFSDHLNYWELGIEAYMLTDTSFFRNTNYHKETDTPETLNYKNMAQVVDGLYNLVIKE
jgi:acetylornithine deacetylase/succinyl-diaminopimelate desuccinylase-like protein